MADKDRANYFYCVRVTDPDIRYHIDKALEWIVEKDPQYEDFTYTPEMLHVTLCEVTLQNDAEVAKASRLLKDLKRELQNKRPSSELLIKGISDFHRKVMIAKVEYEEDFRHFAELLKSRAKIAGIKVNESHDFTPHMTILKVSGMKARKRKVDNLNPWLYINLKDTVFGFQRVESVHLCKMGAERRHDGFYNTPAEIDL